MNTGHVPDESDKRSLSKVRMTARIGFGNRGTCQQDRFDGQFYCHQMRYSFPNRPTEARQDVLPLRTAHFDVNDSLTPPFDAIMVSSISGRFLYRSNFISFGRLFCSYRAESSLTQ